MGFFRRLFSLEHRRAIRAEAAGDYLAAAQSYALCGEQRKVAEMHLARARAAQQLEPRLQALQTALGFLPQGDLLRERVLAELGQAQREQAGTLGLLTPPGQRALREAAGAYEEGQAYAEAGDCWRELGDPERAAAAYSKAGLVEQVEAVLSQQEEELGRRRREEQLFRDYELELQAGRRDAALQALRGCLEVARHPTEYRAVLAALEERLLVAGAVTLRLGERRLALAGQFPLLLGREPDCSFQLRGPAVSRHHAHILYGPAGFSLEDAGSHNGTSLDGLRLGATLPLADTGVLGLGEGCTAEYRVLGAALYLRVTCGLDQGKELLASPQPLALAELLPAGGPPLVVWFVQGRPYARCTRGELRLNGARVAEAVQLLRDDRLELEGHAIGVLG